MEQHEHQGIFVGVNRSYIGAIPIAGNAVTGLAVSPDGAFLYVACEVADEFSAANPTPDTDQVVGSITVASIATAATSPATSVVGRAFVGRAPVRVDVSADGATLWVTARGSNALLALDSHTLLSTTCNPLLATVPVGPAPVGLTIMNQGKVIAVADSNRFAQPQEDQTVTLVDVTLLSLIGHVTVGAFPREVAADGTALFVSNFNSSSISGIDLTELPLP